MVPFTDFGVIRPIGLKIGIVAIQGIHIFRKGMVYLDLWGIEPMRREGDIMENWRGSGQRSPGKLHSTVRYLLELQMLLRFCSPVVVGV